MSEYRFASGQFEEYAPDVLWPHPRSLRVWPPLRHVERFARAPWFHPAGVTDIPLLTAYTHAGEYPDGIPVEAVESLEWQMSCCVPDHAIFRRRNAAGQA